MATSTFPAIQKSRPFARHLELTSTARPAIADDEVLVEVLAAGICGSDVHLYAWDESIRDRLLSASDNFRESITIGHEFCGKVVEIGSSVNTTHSRQYRPIRVGDFISAESHVACGKCRQCLLGQYHVCESDVIIGFDRAGGFSKFIALPASCVWVCHDDLEPEIAAIQEPLGNAMHAATAFELERQRVAIFGAGPIGLMVAAIARASRAVQVVVVDTNPHRLEIAGSLGVTTVLAPQDNAVPFDPAMDYHKKMSCLLEQEFGGHAPDVVLEMSGATQAIDCAFTSVRRGGSVVLFGLPKDATVPIRDYAKNIVFKGLTIKAIVGRQLYQSWEQVHRFLADRANRSLIRQIITDVMPYDQFHGAFEKLLEGRSGKIVLDFSNA